MANALFRNARLALGLTQRQIEDQVRDLVEATTERESSFDVGYVSRIERGLITWPHEHYRRALCLVLKAGSAAELGLVAKQLHHHDRHDEVSPSKRRDVLAGALSALLPPPTTLSRLRRADVAAIAERTGVLEHLDRQSGGRAVHEFALRELQASIDLTTASTTPTMRTALLGAIARLANLAAWSSFDAGRYTEARQLFRLGLTAGHEHGDPGLLCHLATNAARQEIHLRRPGQALLLVDQVDANVPPAARAMLAAVRAQAYALNGEELQTVRQLLAVERTYDRVTDLTAGPAWTTTITAAKVGSDTGFALYLLSAATGRHNPRVVADLQRAARDDNTQARVRAMATARLATVFYRRGDRAEGDCHAARAEELAMTVGSARLAAALTDMRRAAGAPAAR